MNEKDIKVNGENDYRVINEGKPFEVHLDSEGNVENPVQLAKYTFGKNIQEKQTKGTIGKFKAYKILTALKKCSSVSDIHKWVAKYETVMYPDGVDNAEETLVECQTVYSPEATAQMLKSSKDRLIANSIKGLNSGMMTESEFKRAQDSYHAATTVEELNDAIDTHKINMMGNLNKVIDDHFDDDKFSEVVNGMIDFIDTASEEDVDKLEAFLREETANITLTDDDEDKLAKFKAAVRGGDEL